MTGSMHAAYHKVSMNKAKSPRELADEFLRTAAQFQLGDLPTEASHPETRDLGQLSRHDLAQAISLLKKIEVDAVSNILVQIPLIEEMAEEMRQTLQAGGRIFLCGCGATGRLSLTLETLWREQTESSLDSVLSFMAGGDYALVRSIENFEDYPEYGARQLQDLGFREGDLLVSCTEGGETPFVIGATEKAVEISKRPPYFLYCNPDDILCRLVTRSKRVIENPRIRKINLTVGPMAISGSTRLQATTVLMLATGAALFTNCHGPTVAAELKGFLDHLHKADFQPLAPLIEKEAELYLGGNFCIHATNDYPITVLTDSTERSPTFSLLSFENSLEELRPPAWTYLLIPEARSAIESWQFVLKRAPRALTWPTFVKKFGHEMLLGFDFSPQTFQNRKQATPLARHEIYQLKRTEADIEISLEQMLVKLKKPTSLLGEHLLLKVALNISSTLVMGRVGRFENNLMLWVKSSNNKLIDRSIRYVRELLKNSGVTMISYEGVAYALFETMVTLQPHEPAVLGTFERILASHKKKIS